MTYVYHVVTERPMNVGQKIIFDNYHHNGVYNRVTTFMKITKGEDVQGSLANLIKADMAKWAKVAYREIAMEKVRSEEFPYYPSRLACLYTSRNLEEARSWAKFFTKIGRKVYSIVELKVNGNIFDGDACKCFDGTQDEEENCVLARRYWMNDIANENPVIETLVDGEIIVNKIIEILC